MSRMHFFHESVYRTALSSIVRRGALDGSTVLITGATGMVCSTVARLIIESNYYANAGIHLILAGRDPHNLEQIYSSFPNVSFTYFDAATPDIRDLSGCRLDLIIHGAGNSSPQAIMDDPIDTLMGSVLGTDAMLKLAAMTGARMIYISSSEVYGSPAAHEGVFNESNAATINTTVARSCYPAGKCAGETLCSSYRDQLGVNVTAVRPGHVYGIARPQDNHVFAQMLRAAAKRENIVLKSSGQQERSWILSIDCASAILSVATSGCEAPVYNISNERSNATIRHFAELTARIAHVNVLCSEPNDTDIRISNPMRNSTLNDGLISAIGWESSYDLEHGIEITLEGYRSVYPN
jgi:nucleoside-diphosphate-sugar epimerase